MEEKRSVIQHRFVLEKRSRGQVSGVKDVRSFDEKVILLATEEGQITIKGEGLHVNLLDLEKGEVELSGKVDSVVYGERKGSGRKNESLMKRLFQ